MASNDSAKGSAAGKGGVNKIVPFGSSQQSGNSWMGIDDRVASGTNGSRPDSTAGKYGGDSQSGDLFKGNSAGASSSKESNSGSNEKSSAASGQYGPGSPEWLKGTYGSRENMPKYGGDVNKGQLVGAGAGATKDSNPQDQIKRDLPSQPGQDLIAGTNADRSEYERDKKGIGKPGKSGARQ